MKNIEIISYGKYLPKNKVTNIELEKQLDLEDRFIEKRTGIKNRYYVEEETLEYMVIKASVDAIKNSNIDKEEIDMIIVSSTSTNKLMPGISYLVQSKLDIKDCMCLDILAGCNGYINAFDVARNYIMIGKIKCALVIGVEALSKVTDKKDVSTSILLADGAGATIIKQTNIKKQYYSIIKSIGQQSEILKYDFDNKIKMDGTKIYKYAITDTIEKINELLKQANEDIGNIKYIIPHQSNLKIIKGIANRLNVDIDKFYINIENVGNTFCASIPIALEEISKKDLLSKGDKIILLGYGGGLNTGCILLEI